MFAIVGEQRTGTTGLGSALNQHPDIKMYGEIFLDVPTEYDSFFRFWGSKIAQEPEKIYPKWSTFSPILDEYVEELQRKANTNVIGIQIKYDHFFMVPHLEPWLRTRNVKIIHIKRRSLLKTYFSQRSLEARRLAGLTAHTFSKSERSILVDLPNEIEIRRQLRDLNTRIREGERNISRLTKTDVYYEAIYGESKSSELNRIQEFIGLEPQDIDFGLKKSITAPLHEMVSNPEMVDVIKRLSREESEGVLY